MSSEHKWPKWKFKLFPDYPKAMLSLLQKYVTQYIRLGFLDGWSSCLFAKDTNAQFLRPGKNQNFQCFFFFQRRQALITEKMNATQSSYINFPSPFVLQRENQCKPT